jgi:hypothetical protein
MSCSSKYSPIFIVLDSALLATGILLVLVACIQYANWWPLLTIFVHFFAIVCPIVCGGCSGIGLSEDDQWLTDNGSGARSLALISWLLVGFFVVIGYAIPAILLRGEYLPEVGLLFTFAGGTIILISILLFTRVVYFKPRDGHAYVWSTM